MATTTVDYAGQVLTDVRRQIAVDDDVLSETKARRNLVKRHAEEHTRLLNDVDISVRVHRARVIRLAKAAVKQDATPVVSSFNLESLALDHVDDESTIAEGLRDLLLDGADSLADGPTPDPAGVSDPIKLPDGVSRATAVARLRELGEAVSRAVDAETLEDAEVALSEVFPDYVESGSTVRSLGDALRRQKRAQVGAAFGSGAADLKPARAYGDEAR